MREAFIMKQQMVFEILSGGGSGRGSSGGYYNDIMV
jgi:hypothetical protein